MSNADTSIRGCNDSIASCVVSSTSSTKISAGNLARIAWAKLNDFASRHNIDNMTGLVGHRKYKNANDSRLSCT
jgi:hypothetical protein